MVASLEYEAKRARMFRVEQPIGEMLTVRSTSPSDTSQTLTLEGDGAVPSEDIMLDGTTGVTTVDSFDSLDAFELDAETAGDVVVEDGAGDELVRLKGTDSYDGAIGDLGVPALGAVRTPTLSVVRTNTSSTTTSRRTVANWLPRFVQPPSRCRTTTTSLR